MNASMRQKSRKSRTKSSPVTKNPIDGRIAINAGPPGPKRVIWIRISLCCSPLRYRHRLPWRASFSCKHRLHNIVAVQWLGASATAKLWGTHRRGFGERGERRGATSIESYPNRSLIQLRLYHEGSNSQNWHVLFASKLETTFMTRGHHLWEYFFLI